MNDTCTMCGYDLDSRGGLRYGDESPLCRDCFAFYAAGRYAHDPYDLGDADLESGYDDADTVLDGGRLPY